MNRRRIAVMLGPSLAVAAAWYGLSFREQEHRVSRADSAVRANTSALSAARAELNTATKAHADRATNDETVQAAGEAVPTDLALDDVETATQSLAESLGVVLDGISAATSGSSEVPSDVHDVHDRAISITAHGTYDALERFTSGLQALPRGVLVDGIELQADGAAFRAVYNARVFYRSPVTPTGTPSTATR